MVDVISSFEALLAAVLGLSAAWLGRQGHLLARAQRQAGLRESVRAALLDLTTGEVEEARHVIGTLRYGAPKAGGLTTEAITRSYFRLSWALERSAVSFQVVNGESKERSGSTARIAQHALRHEWRWHLEEISRNVEIVATVASLHLEDPDASERRRQVFAALGLKEPDSDYVRLQSRHIEGVLPHWLTPSTP